MTRTYGVYYDFCGSVSSNNIVFYVYKFQQSSDFLESLGGDQPSMFSEQGMPVNVNTTEKFFLTAADPSDGTNEDRLTQVINAKFEAGFLKPYNYVNGYSRLQKYMDTK
jgi:hypothetical protein